MTNYTWIGTSADYNLTSNWSPSGVPGSSDTAIFNDVALEFDVTLSGSRSVSAWSFTGNADYTFTTSSNLFFLGSGIAKGAGDVTITVAQGAGSWLRFENASTADDAKIVNFQNLTFRHTSTAGEALIENHFVSYGTSIQFENQSSAADATIMNNDGQLSFAGESTAASATLDNASSTDKFGAIVFGDTSSAGDATIVNHVSTGVFRTPQISFFGNSTAATSSITNDGNLFFNDASSAGAATIVNRETLTFGQYGSPSPSTASAGQADITNSGTLSFLGKSSAGSAEITNTDTIYFQGSSSAGSARIVHDDGPSFGSLYFWDSSNAGSAVISGTGDVSFSGTASAGSANFTTTGSFSFGGSSTAGSAKISVAETLYFFGGSTAGNAAITTLAGATTTFAGSATAGKARLNTLAGGIVNASSTNGASGDGKISVGSIAGAGIYYLGNNELTVGAIGTSTTVSGSIRDGSPGGDVGASLVKVGAGTLTLTGANTYTGATAVKAGTLALSGSGANITSKSVSIDASGKLTGNLTFMGAVANTLDVKGMLSGAVALGDGADQVSNSGAMSGAIRLGAGEDTFAFLGGIQGTVFGDAGADRFEFRSGPVAGNPPFIGDFTRGEDKIVLSRAEFDGFKKDGALAKKQFLLGKKAKDKADRVIYDKKSGHLLHDPDGKGGTKAVVFADVDGVKKLAPDDILIVA